MDLEMEARHLLQADRHIMGGTDRIMAQEVLLSRLRLDGRETDAAEKLLLLLRETLECWEFHRSLIVMALGGSAEAGPGPHL